MRRLLLCAGVVAIAGLVPASSARAQFGLSINTPGASVGIGTGVGAYYPGYVAPPVVVAPAPVVVAPAPVIVPRPYYGPGYYGRPGGYYGRPGGYYGGHHGGYYGGRPGGHYGYGGRPGPYRY